MKKILALILTLTMVVGLMSVSAWAATITVNNAYENETYDAYKILEYTRGSTTTRTYYTDAEKTTPAEEGVVTEYYDETTTPNDSYSYYLETSNSNYAALKTLLEGCTPAFHFTESADGTQAFVDNADDLKDKGEQIAAYLYENLNTLKTIALDKSEGNKGTADKTVVMDDLAQGYWFVTSSLGSLCTLQSYDDEELVVEKNETLVPPPKTVSDSEAQVGDILTYTVTLTDVKGTNLKAQIVDTMSEGLTYNEDAVLKATVKGTETTLTKGNQYTETKTTDADGNTVITWEITAEQMTAMDTGDTIVVTYSATVNTKASIDGTETNTAITRYSEQETDGIPVEIITEDLTINKVDENKAALKGAKFELYREVTTETEVPSEEEGGEPTTETSTEKVIVKLTKMTDAEIAEALATTKKTYYTDDTYTTTTEEVTEFVKEETVPGKAAADTVYYKVDPNSNNTTIDMTDASSAVVFGIDKDDVYYVREIEAPEGFNKLEEDKKVEAGTASIDVENKSGTVLPSTGGIGTTIFYIVGGLLAVGAGVVLVTKKRMSKEDV